MAPPFKSVSNLIHGHGFVEDPPHENPPSNNLWIGNVSPDASEMELRSLFEKYGKVDSFSFYSTRNYAFIYFKNVGSAISARQGLQGHALRGNSLKIEFAKPAKPCKSLWVSGISQSVSREDLEKEFLRFGKIQEFRFLRERSSACIDYVGLEDATLALRNMNGKRIGGSQLRVDFLRSQPPRRETGPDVNEGQFPRRNMVPVDFRFMAQDLMNNYAEPSLSGSKRTNPFLPMGPQYGDAMASKVLWIRYPPSVILEDDMLHNAMILFGEIERIKTFNGKNYAFVEFRSVDEARRAKEGLQGKLFNDPRILIDYFKDEFPGMSPFQQVRMDLLGHNRSVILGHNPGHPSPYGIHGHDLYIRPPAGLHGAFEPAQHGPELDDFPAVPKLQNHIPQTPLGGSAWRRSSPTRGLISSPSAGFNIPNRSAPWDATDANQLQREPKKSRIDAPSPLERTEHYGLHSLRSGGAPGALTRNAIGGHGRRFTESDSIWRGLIAKGGTPVCRARCVPVGDGLGVDIPDTVNCSARTGLDLLSQHYHQDAIGFGVVLFLPDSEDDFASYTDFLQYLGSKDRAGVAKFEDGTTLFLVPPSDFLFKVLEVDGPERLYGVVLKFPEIVPGSPSLNPRSMPVPYADPPKRPNSQRAYAALALEERGSHLEPSRGLPEEFKPPPKAPSPVTNHVAPPTTTAPPAGLSLTPELIATLASLLPANNTPQVSSLLSQAPANNTPQASSLLSQAPANNTPQVSSFLSQAPPSILDVTSNVSAVDTNAAHWNRENQAEAHNGQFMPPHGWPINPQLQHPQTAQAVVPPMISVTAGQYYQSLNPYSQHHGDLTSHGGSCSRLMLSAISSLQRGPAPVAPEINQHYQHGNFQDAFKGQGIENGADSLKPSYDLPMFSQPMYPVTVSNQMHVNPFSQPQPYVQQPSEVELVHQNQPLQTAPFGVAQENTETDADKNERYKTTLLFAANLLSRIHQPSDNQPGPGAGSN